LVLVAQVLVLALRQVVLVSALVLEPAWV
jgi:hypothetical protein